MLATLWLVRLRKTERGKKPHKKQSHSNFKVFLKRPECPRFLKHEAFERQVRYLSVGPTTLTSQHYALARREPRASLLSKHITFRASGSNNTSSNGLFLKSLRGKLIYIPRKESARLPGGWHRTGRRGAFYSSTLSHSPTDVKPTLGKTVGKSTNAGASTQHEWLREHFLGRLTNLPDLPF